MFYKIQNSKLEKLATKAILERDIQNLVEKNLNDLFGLEFVSTEFSIENVRFDTLAFDRENNTPVIIEFKKSFEKSLFDQGLEYLNILFSRKADFAITLHKKLGISPDPDKISWENAKVIFVSGRYSERQKRAISFQGLPIELWSFDWLENDILKIEQETLSRTAKLSEFSKSTNGGVMAIKKVQSEIKEYDERHHMKKASNKMWELFEMIRDEVLNWDDLDIKYNKDYIDFKKNGSSLFSVEIQKKQIKITFGKKKNNIKYDGVKLRDVSNTGKWGNGDFQIIVNDEKNLTDLYFVLKKTYENF